MYSSKKKRKKHETGGRVCAHAFTAAKSMSTMYLANTKVDKFSIAQMNNKRGKKEKKKTKKHQQKLGEMRDAHTLPQENYKQI